VRDIYLSM